MLTQPGSLFRDWLKRVLPITSAWPNFRIRRLSTAMRLCSLPGEHAMHTALTHRRANIAPQVAWACAHDLKIGTTSYNLRREHTPTTPYHYDEDYDEIETPWMVSMVDRVIAQIEGPPPMTDLRIITDILFLVEYLYLYVYTTHDERRNIPQPIFPEHLPTMDWWRKRQVPQLVVAGGMCVLMMQGVLCEGDCVDVIDAWLRIRCPEVQRDIDTFSLNGASLDQIEFVESNE